MKNVAGFALTVSALFLAVVSVFIQAPALFYMGTALFATIGACNFQAYLSVRGLRFERVAPGSAQLGDVVTVEITVWSERKLRRPLITVLDRLPQRLKVNRLSPSLPIAPAYDLPVRTQYQFEAARRGVYRWKGVTAVGTDALGLVTKTKDYETDPAEITVLPRPIPVTVDMPLAAGWGISEAESGQTRGAGIEPRGIREYSTGDSLRHVHWRSSARAGRLLVKEFEAGTHAAAAFVLPRRQGSDIGPGPMSSLDLMCGHAAFLADRLLRQGARVEFPALEVAGRSVSTHEREAEILELLARIHADTNVSIGSDAVASLERLTPGSVVFVMTALPEDDLVGAIGALSQRGITTVALLYDARQFDPKSAATACDPAYIASIQGAGAHVEVMEASEGS
ncbi:DUF58 domain-containing protein [bacterium]|nr:MAG: DUF58 domain-containing protein [bacterium]